MTIVESIKEVLASYKQGLTSRDIYSKIIEKSLYTFGAADPVGVVNSQIRRRCVGLDFPTSYPDKQFVIIGYDGKRPKYALIGDETENKPGNVSQRKESNSDRLPEEIIVEALGRHFKTIKNQIAERILSNSPAFFERLVVDLLIKMGYGYDEKSGFVTGRSHDGGIDGIIFEDNLGLDRIYIQAKRYAPENTVGREALQAFVGAMEDVNKGVFITTSHFAKEAIKYADKQQQKNIKLIDGMLLADLLVRFEVGISTVQIMKLHRIDSDYYGD